MLGIDTNVLVRLLVEDDPGQTRRARQIVEQARVRDESVVVSLLVLLETEWVLRSRYAFDKSTILMTFRHLLESVDLEFEDEGAVEEALYRWNEFNVGFADTLIVAHNRRLGCDATATFDARAAQVHGFVAA